MKRAFKLILLFAVISGLLIYFCDKAVIKQANDKTFDKTTKTPANKIGLLLGTGKFLKSGKINPYYQNRIDATVELFKANKIEKIVISGDNSTENYNEPQTMMDDLVANGIPAENIYLDYAGFRTLDSVYRLNKIFGQHKFTIISQKFHNERAIYIANYLGLDAIGFNAKDVSKTQGIKTNVREKLARVKVYIDKMTNKKPKFLGDKIYIE